MMDAIAKDIGATYIGHLFKLLNEYGVEQHVNAKVVEIKEDMIVLEDQEIKVDNVIIATGYKSNNSIIEDIKDRFKEVYVVGDANSPRRILDSVKEGFLASSQI
jgi:thioredoxin reductase